MLYDILDKDFFIITYVISSSYAFSVLEKLNVFFFRCHTSFSVFIEVHLLSILTSCMT